MGTANIHLPFGNRFNAPKIIVLHAMAEYIHANEAVVDYYKGKGKVIELNRDYSAVEWLRALGYSAHKLVTPSGLTIKCRDYSQGAYHAKGYNTDSLGIEFLVPGIHTYGSFIEALKTPYLSPNAFDSGVEVVRAWMNLCNIEKGEIRTHEELSPDRKKDPGSGYPLNDFLNAL